MAQFHFDPDSYLELMAAEVPDYARLQEELVTATDIAPVRRVLELGTARSRRPGACWRATRVHGAAKAELFGRVAGVLRPGGRFVLADVIVPDPADVVTPVDGDYDKPSRVSEQVAWLAAAGFRSSVAWARRDLAVLVADREVPERR